MRETLSLIFMVIGCFFNLFGCIGLVRLPDVYNRLQASTKCVTLGTCCVLFGILISGPVNISFKAFLTIVFILISSPTVAHALSRASIKSGIKLWEKSVVNKMEEE
ncbi:MAG: monovalent cation/H(+) antiporter subunit G [Candidatus Omnitrophica bacterium]|nr:monovalent cation/H(+) antiporter subunit G [Candidatus Omnitrophota bacterium]MCM8810220.1 monovalent cation/H(+) antiporter subunit G [Candidatus Omnitrophota bacterium]